MASARGGLFEQLMGIDIGAVDLVLMASAKGVSRAISELDAQSSRDRNSHGILVATNSNDLVEATVTARSFENASSIRSDPTETVRSRRPTIVEWPR